MNDNWNLKNCKKTKTWVTDNPNIYWYTYKTTDIETLREKLLSDIEGFEDDGNNDEISLGAMLEIKKIINKRFGVDKINE